MATLDELNDQVADLTTATTDLLEEVVGQKDKLETAASEASSDAASAASSANSAYNSQTISSSEAARAEAAADAASQVSGLDTVEEAVEVALSEYAGVMSEAEARAIQLQNEHQFAASGFVHNGKGTTSVVYHEVNQGLMVRSDISDFSNSVVLGRVGASQDGISKTPYPVIHIAGSVINALHVGSRPEFFGVSYEVPPAPDGAQIYDSTGNARGSGEPNLNLKTDVDPKYGDVPTGTEEQILNEAIERAFEGWVGNSNFRLPLTNSGVGNWNGSSNPNINIVDGRLELDAGAQGSNVSTIQKLTASVVAGAKYKVVVSKVTGANTATANLSTTGGFDPDLQIIRGSDPAGIYEYEYTAEHSGDLYIQLYGINNSVGTFSRVTFHPITEEVVTHPVDLLMFEYYEEELTGRQEVFECIQSLSTTFGTTSVPTVLSERPLSYFQQYDGQFEDPTLQNDRYRCVVWSELTDPQKREVAAYMGERLFMGVNGLPVNGRLRARTIRGARNGDWSWFDVATAEADDTNRVMQPDNRLRVMPQGKNSSMVGDGTSLQNDLGSWYGTLRHSSASMPQHIDKTGNGVWLASNVIDGHYAYKGRCLAYVVATVPRANQGAYHPSLNPWGCRTFLETNVSSSLKWYEVSGIESPADCFVVKTSGVYPSPLSGYVESRFGSGHPDGLFYDGIEAGGLNGIIDWRLPAYDMSSGEEASNLLNKVIDGTYRGLEKLVFTKVHLEEQTATTDPNAKAIFADNSSGTYKVGDYCYLSNISKTTTIKIQISNVTSTTIGWDPSVWGAWNRSSESVYLIHETKLDISVSGGFNTQMVVGAPVNILQTEALKYGWLGTWCDEIPDGTPKVFKFSRKDLIDGYSRTYTDDNGAVWGSTASRAGSWNATINAMVNESMAATRVDVHSYKAFAKQTVEASSKPMLNGAAGLGGIYYTMRDLVGFGNLLAESLLGEILTSSYTVDHKGFLLIERSNMNPTDSTLGVIKHAPLVLDAPVNNSKAVKTLWYQTSTNDQVGLNFAYSELSYGTPTYVSQDESATSWSSGVLYKITSGPWRGYWSCVASLNTALTNQNVMQRSDGNIYFQDGTLALVRLATKAGSGWGDDSTIRIRDGRGTYINLNGDTCLYGTSKLAISYGWVFNHSRAGVQKV